MKPLSCILRETEDFHLAHGIFDTIQVYKNALKDPLFIYGREMSECSTEFLAMSYLM